MNVIPFPKETECCCNKTGNSGSVLHVPAAQRANARGRFASTEKSIQAMMPVEAFNWVSGTLGELNADAVYITGPGDPLAEPDPTMETLQLMKGKFPQLGLGITTLGLGGQANAEMLKQNGINNVTLLVDGVDTDIIQSLYAWIRPGKKTVPLAKAAEILLDEQMKAIQAFKESGFTVDIRTTVYPGINDEHIEDIARKMASLNADSMTLVPCNPRAEEDIPPKPDTVFMAQLFETASKYIQVKIAGQETGSKRSTTSTAGNSPVAVPKPNHDRPNVAVVSSNGMDVDLHLGQAIKILIYGPRDDGLACLLETRSAPAPGGGGSRWEKLADSLGDCFALLTASAGDNPRQILSSHGISVIITDNNIEGMVDVLYGGGKKGKCKK